MVIVFHSNLLTSRVRTTSERRSTQTYARVALAKGRRRISGLAPVPQLVPQRLESQRIVRSGHSQLDFVADQSHFPVWLFTL